MPEEFDPKWEYWTPSEEIAEVFQTEIVRDYTVFTNGEDTTHRYNNRSGFGFRIGKGNPDKKCNFHFAREKPKKIRQSKFVSALTLPHRCKMCRKEFYPLHKRYTNYCTARCGVEHHNILNNSDKVYKKIVLEEDSCPVCKESIDRTLVREKTKGKVKKLYCSDRCRRTMGQRLYTKKKKEQQCKN